MFLDRFNIPNDNLKDLKAKRDCTKKIREYLLKGTDEFCTAFVVEFVDPAIKDIGNRIDKIERIIDNKPDGWRGGFGRQ